MGNFFSQYLIMLRQQNDMTQDDLAKRIGVTKATVSKWENYEFASISGKRMQQLSGIFHVHPYTFVSAATMPYPQEGKSKYDLLKEINSIKPGSANEISAPKQEAAGAPANTVPFEPSTRLSMSGNRIAAGHGVGQSDAAEEIYETNFPTDEHFAVQAVGDAMYPKIENGDTLILRRTATVEDGNIAAIYVGKDETPLIREVHIDEDGNLILIALKSRAAKPKIYTAAQRASIPVRICGKVVEIRKQV